MKIFKFLILLYAFIFCSLNGNAQTFSILYNKLKTENLSQCYAIEKYIHKGFDFDCDYNEKDFYRIRYFDNNNDPYGHWDYFIRKDSLVQVGFSSLELPIKEEWFNLLYKKADSLINAFTVEYGKPIKSTLKKENFYQKGKKQLSCDIIKALWLIDGEKLKVDFSIDGEHNQFHYAFSAIRFKDYFNWSELPAWWDGY